jgi:phosphoglycerate dehydrogenase-like enzyme
MTAQHAALRDLSDELQEQAERVRATGEPLLLDEAGVTVAALISAEDLELLVAAAQERLDWIRRAGAGARHSALAGASEEEIVLRVRKGRRDYYRERYG